MSVTDAVWAAGLLLVSPDVLVMSVGAGAVLSQLIRRRPPRKIAFNVGQYLVSISAALVVFSALGGDPGPVTGLGWLPVVPAMAAFLVVNATSVALVVGLTEGRGVATILRRPFVPNLLHFACNTAIGVLAAILWSTEPTAVPLLLAPVSLSYFAYRSLANVALERDRMRDLYEAGRTLLGPIESSADFYPFLGLVQRMLDATLVEVVVAEENELVVHDSAGHTSRRGAEPDGGGRISLGSYLGAAVDSRRDAECPGEGRGGARGGSRSPGHPSCRADDGCGARRARRPRLTAHGHAREPPALRRDARPGAPGRHHQRLLRRRLRRLPGREDPFLEPGNGRHVQRAGGRRDRSPRARAALGWRPGRRRGGLPPPGPRGARAPPRRVPTRARPSRRRPATP